MNWTVILSYLSLLLFWRASYMEIVSFLFFLSDRLTPSAENLRIGLCSFLIWLSISSIWKGLNGSVMPVFAFSTLLFLFSAQLTIPLSKEIEAQVHSEILGLIAAMIYVYSFMSESWY